MTSRIQFIGGPLDGKIEERVLPHNYSQASDIFIFVPPDPTSPYDTRLKRGRYRFARAVEVLAIYEWAGVA